MNEPRWVVDKGDGRPYFELADGERTALVGYVRRSRGVSAEAALVALIREADTLRQARELAEVIRAFENDDAPELTADLLDLLAPVPDTGDQP